MKSKLLREQELRESLADPDERRELNLYLADLRAAPEKAHDTMRLLYAHVWRRCWAVRDMLDDDCDTMAP